MSALTTDVVVEAPVRSRRDVRRFQRYAAAVVLLMPATLVGIGRLFQTNDDDTRAALDRIAQQPGRQFTFALLGFMGYVFVVPAFLAAARLARRRRPVLTTVALSVNLLAYLGGTAMVGLDSMYLAGAELPAEQRDAAASMIDKMWSTGLSGVSTGLFVAGHVIGAILMGFALRGSIPAAGWLAMILSQPGHVVAFVVLQNPVADMAAWLLMSACFAFCAAAILRTPDDAWEVPPLTR
ncbi:hypothetical protein [Kribbella sp. C-35]|uniref:hypothetical protein n=1 Tax=Kribbella sp. C-35 TaxID=2789276 RepID=UPI0039798D28